MCSLSANSHASGPDPGRFQARNHALVPFRDRRVEAMLKCFVVEDSVVIRQNLVATLQELLPLECVGYAEDEATALVWLRQSAPADLLIIDIFLKSGSGLEVLRQARPARPAAKLVVLTNYATAEMRKRCLQLGADRVFDKSAELEELIAYCEGLAGEA